MRFRIQQVADDALDRVMDLGRMDLIQDFAIPLSVTVICDLLGIPEAHRKLFYKFSAEEGRLLDPVPMSRPEINKASAGNAASELYFRKLLERRRLSPKNDLMTLLLQAEEEGKKLTADELIANIIMLFAAGHETTVNLIGNAVLALHRNPGQLALLRANPTLMKNAVEELLRYDSPVQMTARVALVDVDELGGRRITKGQTLLCLLGSANRDPAVYPDRPEDLNITRPNVRPLSFGGGIHYCLGAQLARIEGEVAIATLIRRLPTLRLENVLNPEWRPTFVLRGLRRLPANW
jgi:cytochrome P450